MTALLACVAVWLLLAVLVGRALRARAESDRIAAELTAACPWVRDVRDAGYDVEWRDLEVPR